MSSNELPPDVVLNVRILKWVHTSPLFSALLGCVATIGFVIASSLDGRRTFYGFKSTVVIAIIYGGGMVAHTIVAAFRAYPTAERYTRHMVTLFMALVLVYANIYLIMSLGTPAAFEGIVSPWETLTADGYGRLSPSSVLLAFVDCFHFSCVTITTLGFGDMRPVHWAAKLLTDTEVFLGVAWIAIGVGRLISRTANVAK